MNPPALDTFASMAENAIIIAPPPADASAATDASLCHAADLTTSGGLQRRPLGTRPPRLGPKPLPRPQSALEESRLAGVWPRAYAGRSKSNTSAADAFSSTTEASPTSSAASPSIRRLPLTESSPRTTCR